jgi:hypothetical protein
LLSFLLATLAHVQFQLEELTLNQTKLTLNQTKLTLNQTKLTLNQKTFEVRLSAVDSEKHGVTTEAEMVQRLISSSLLGHNEEFDRFLVSSKVDGWFEQKHIDGITFSTDLPESDKKIKDTNEIVEGVQSYVDSVLKKVFQNKALFMRGGKAKNLFSKQQVVSLTSTYVHGSHKKASFLTRKPDLPFFDGTRHGGVAVVWFGDCKGSGTGEFSDADIGHVLDMGRVLMMQVQVARSMMVVFLTDGNRFQYFRILRQSSGLYYHFSTIFTGIEAWQVKYSSLFNL